MATILMATISLCWRYRNTMQTISRLFVKLSAIIVGFVVALGIIYGWLLPAVFKDINRSFRQLCESVVGLSARFGI